MHAWCGERVARVVACEHAGEGGERRDGGPSAARRFRPRLANARDSGAVVASAEAPFGDEVDTGAERGLGDGRAVGERGEHVVVVGVDEVEPVVAVARDRPRALVDGACGGQVQRFLHQASAREPRRIGEGVLAVRDRDEHAVLVDAEPRAARHVVPRRDEAFVPNERR
jgi:hypothetical protein